MPRPSQRLQEKTPSSPVPLHLGQKPASLRTKTTPAPLQARQVKSPFSRPEPEHLRQVTTGGVTLISPVPLYTGQRLVLPYFEFTPLPEQYAQVTTSTKRLFRDRLPTNFHDFPRTP